MNRLAIAFTLFSVLLCTGNASADTFGSGADTFDIEFVTIGNPGNADDTTGFPNPAGQVDSTYRIGKFEISEDMIDKANAQSSLNISHTIRGPNKPAASIMWFEAAQFVNWLNTDSGSTPAYKFNGNVFELWQPADAGYNPGNLYRNSQAKYFLPSADEWYKAAYYDPTGSDTAPLSVASGTEADTAVYDQSHATGPADITQAGGLSPYGTMGQGGNVLEWEETDFDLVNDSTLSDRGVRGGNFLDGGSLNMLSSVRHSDGPSEIRNIGFRIATAIPEPTTLTLAALSHCLVATRRRR